eukprot:2006163-Pyramimonas_sp.AAC.1
MEKNGFELARKYKKQLGTLKAKSGSTELSQQARADNAHKQEFHLEKLLGHQIKAHEMVMGQASYHVGPRSKEEIYKSAMRELHIGASGTWTPSTQTVGTLAIEDSM